MRDGIVAFVIVVLAALLIADSPNATVRAAPAGEMRLLIRGYVDRHGKSATAIVGPNGISDVRHSIRQWRRDLTGRATNRV
jgi:hypothetical protein